MLIGKKLELVSISKDYIETAYKMVNDYEVMSGINPVVFRPLSIEDEHEWFENVKKNKNDYQFAMKLLNSSTYVGGISLHGVNHLNQRCTYGIYVGKEHWGKGYAKEATELILEYAFQELNLNRIHLEVFAFNERAITLYEKLGFKKEGTLREHLFREGKFHDTHIMSLLKSDYKA